MFFGNGTTSSVTHPDSARPNELVVLVNTKPPTPAATDSSSSVRVPVTLVSTKSRREWDSTCGLCNVAGCRTAVTPRSAARTTSRSATDPTTDVNGDAFTSSPTTSRPCADNTRTSASPRWPALPVTRIRSTSLTVRSRRNRFVDHPEPPPVDFS
jgi:hypothetical protein